MNMTLQSSIKDRILAAQKEAVDESEGLQKGLEEMIKQRSDGTLYYLDQIWVSLKGDFLVAWNEKGIAENVKVSYRQICGLRLGRSFDEVTWLGIKDDNRARSRRLRIDLKLCLISEKLCLNEEESL
ncbi:hypothetical protein Tco_0589410 [Tanacetum coccineum]